MKPILNPHNRRYISYEDSYSLHQLESRDDGRKFYITKCGKPIAFEEKWETFTWVPPYRFICRDCGLLR